MREVQRRTVKCSQGPPCPRHSGWCLADELLHGTSLAAALDPASGLDAAAELAAHLAAGRFVAFALAEAEASSQGDMS